MIIIIIIIINNNFVCPDCIKAGLPNLSHVANHISTDI